MSVSNYDGDPMIEAVRVQVETMGWKLSDARQEWERHYVEAILDRFDGNVKAAAAAAGVERSNMHRLIRKHGLRRPR